jgi:hypothetical protein
MIYSSFTKWQRKPAKSGSIWKNTMEKEERFSSMLIHTVKKVTLSNQKTKSKKNKKKKAKK